MPAWFIFAIFLFAYLNRFYGFKLYKYNSIIIILNWLQ